MQWSTSIRAFCNMHVSELCRFLPYFKQFNSLVQLNVCTELSDLMSPSFPLYYMVKIPYLNKRSIKTYIQLIFFLFSCIHAVSPRRFSLRKHAYSNILNFFTTKKWKFSDKKIDIFHISARNIDCGYSLVPTIYVLSRNTKNNVYPCKPQFYYIKVGFTGVTII